MSEEKEKKDIEEEPKTLIEQLKDQIQNKDIEFETIVESSELHEKKINFIELAKIYLKYFNQFRMNFSDFEDERVKKIIGDHKAYSLRILTIFNNINNSSNFGKKHFENELFNYVNKFYYEIADFIDFCMEVYEE